MVRRAFAYLTVVVALAALLVTGLVAGCRLFRGEETPVPGSATPGLETMLRLEPASGSPGTIFTVTGEGWPANKIVSLYVGYSLKEALDAKPWGDFVIDGNGRFSTKLSAPVLNVWDRGLDWFVVARLKGGKLDASTVFSIPDPRPGAATATPSPVATTPSSQPTRLEGAVEGIDLQGRLLLVKATDAKTYLFNIAREAVIIAVDGRPLLLSDVQLGTRVVAEGLLKPNGSVDVSRLIITQPSASPTPGQMPTATVVANPSEPNLRVDSIIESIALEARLLTCRDTAGKVLRVNVPPEATILASDGRPLTIGDLRLGYRVVLEGWSNADGSVTASRMIVDAGGLGPTATVTPTPAVVGGWEGTYYNNDSLLGQPALLRMDADLNFDWGANAPAEGIGADRFSARWTKSLTFKSGGYRFRVRADDGVRLWVDGDLLIDEWHDSSATTYEREVYLAAGQHTVRVDYYEAEGEALIQVRWDAVTEFPDWEGQYFNNTNLAGDAALVRNDRAIDFRWEEGAPAAGINADRFSVRWRRVLPFAKGTYRFFAYADDGVRVWIAGDQVLDKWSDFQAVVHQFDLALAEQSYEIIVEYYEGGGLAEVHFWWELLPDITATPTSSPTPSRTPTTMATPTMTRQATASPTWTVVAPTATPSPTLVVPTATATATRASLPDLVITALKIELEAVGGCYEPGAPLGVRVTVQNAGSADAGPFAVEANGAQQMVAQGLRAGQSLALWFNGYAYPGDNRAVADPTLLVEESNEQNNVLSQQLPMPTPPPVCSPAVTATVAPTQAADPGADGKVDPMQASYFPLAALTNAAFDQVVLSLTGTVHNYNSADFPAPPFFRFELQTPEGKSLLVEGGPEAVIMALPAKAAKPAPDKIVVEKQQISPSQHNAQPLYEGGQVKVIGVWVEDRLIAERVQVSGPDEATPWYYRSLLLDQELGGRGAALFDGLPVYVRTVGSRVATLAPEVPARAMAKYATRGVIVQGTFSAGKTPELRQVQVYVRELGGYQRIYPQGGVLPRLLDRLGRGGS